MLTLTIYEQDGMVIMRAETDEGAFDVPMDPDVAEETAVRLMLAVEAARK
jgi:hypothetical protein